MPAWKSDASSAFESAGHDVIRPNRPHRSLWLDRCSRRCFGHSLVPDGPLHDGADLARRVLHGGFAGDRRPGRVYQSLTVLLETSGEGPTLIGIDDVQWTDPMSAGWLQFLAHRLKAASVHLVVTTQIRRAGVVSPADALLLDTATRRLPTYPLGSEATMAMFSEHFGAVLAAPVVAAAHRMTGGTALLVARLLSAIDDLEVPPVDGHRRADHRAGISPRGAVR